MENVSSTLRASRAGVGITNGNGIVNGNGVEKVNSSLRASRAGVGITNGNGIINGNGVDNDSIPLVTTKRGDGITNGNGISDDSSSIIIPGNPIKIEKSNKFLITGVLIIVFLIIALPVVMTLEPYGKNTRISIDGKFGDWKDNIYIDDKDDQSINKNINIISYGVNTDKTKLSFYMKVEDTMLRDYDSNNIRDTIQIFVDLDQNVETGYIINGIGADSMIEMYGRRNEIQSSMYYKFNNSRVNNDWNAWEVMFDVETICDGTELETQLWLDDIGINKGQGVNVYFHIFDPYGNEDFSNMIINNINGALMIKQKAISSNVLVRGKTTKFLELNMEAFGKDVTINSINIKRFSTAVDTDLKSVSLLDENDNLLVKDGFTNGIATLTITHSILTKDESMTAYVAVEISGTATSSHAIGLRVSSIKADTKAITIKGETAIAYIDRVTEKITIDGAFEDWKLIESKSDPIDKNINKNIDINEYKANAEQQASFYLKVSGRIMAGVSIPTDNARSIVQTQKDDNAQVGTQDETPLPIQTGEDTIFVFIDIDQDLETGYRPINNFKVGAEEMIEIKGQYGIILSKTYYIFEGNDQKSWNWEKETINVEAECVSSQMEIQVSNDITDNFDVYFHIMDWEENEDYSDEEISSKYVPSIKKTKGDFDLTVIESPSNSAERFGISVATGDFNDDGKDDLLVGADYYGSPQDGRAYIFYGSSTGISEKPDKTLESKSNDEEFGRSVAVGDFNDDGNLDVLVGAPGYGGGNDYRGGAYVYWGPDFGSSDYTLLYYYSTGRYQYMGQSVAVGDFDKDGKDDALIGVFQANPTGGTDQVGAAHIYLGENIPNSGSHNISDINLSDHSNPVEDEEKKQGFGYAVAAGDYNGDGYDDALVGVPFYHPQSSNQCGRVSLFLGGSSMDSTVDVHLFNGSENSDQNFGYSLTFGNFDGDDYHDALIGAPYKDYKGYGLAYVFEGENDPDNTTSADTILESVIEDEGFGCAVATGDIHNDGYDDAFIGAEAYDNDRGHVYGFDSNDSGGLSTTVSYNLRSESTDDKYFGHAIAIGDFDGNNYGDLAVGSYGYSSDKGRTYVEWDEGQLIVPTFTNVMVPIIAVVAMFILFRKKEKK